MVRATLQRVSLGIIARREFSAILYEHWSIGKFAHD